MNTKNHESYNMLDVPLFSFLCHFKCRMPNISIDGFEESEIMEG